MLGLAKSIKKAIALLSKFKEATVLKTVIHQPKLMLKRVAKVSERVPLARLNFQIIHNNYCRNHYC